MKSKKAYIKLNGEVGEKEQAAIEFVDLKYSEKLADQKKILDKLLKLAQTGKKDAPH